MPHDNIPICAVIIGVTTSDMDLQEYALNLTESVFNPSTMNWKKNVIGVHKGGAHFPVGERKKNLYINWKARYTHLNYYSVKSPLSGSLTPLSRH